MSAKILSVGPLHDADIASLAVHHDVEGIIFLVDPADELLARSLCIRIAKMSDAFVSIIVRLPVDACHFNVRHGIPWD